jgi:hypothetical protein
VQLKPRRERREILVPYYPFGKTVSEECEEQRGISQQQHKLRFERKRK